jgi:lipoprotein-releasing system permease protein
MPVKPDPKIDHNTVRQRIRNDLVVGLVLIAIGAIALATTHSDATHAGTFVYASYGALLVGGLTAARGIWRLVRGFEVRGLGYKSFVAWRYLLVTDRKVSPVTERLLLLGVALGLAFAVLRAAGVGPDDPALNSPIWAAGLAMLVVATAVVFLGVLPHSKPALVLGLVGIVVLGLALVVLKLIGLPRLPFVHLDPAQVDLLKQPIKIAAIVGGVLTGFAMLFGCLRAYFTFFTTVPIGGVWVGTGALVIVLAVMSGFESDLRDKILGSNAHLQITREDGDFVEWRDVKAQIDKMPGVIASSPFAVSEVVVAANNTGMNVIIKGIDPKTVGKVTDLVSDLEDREAMKRLEPIVSDSLDLRVPQLPRTGTGPVIDPPPEDMPAPGDPIDFSGAALGSADATGSGSAGSASERADTGPGMPPAAGRGDAGSGGALDSAPPLGGDAKRLLDAEKEFGGDEAIHDAIHEAIHGASEHPIEHPSEHPIHEAPAHAIDEPAGQPDPGAGISGDGAALPVIDPPPPDLVSTDEPPADYSRPDYLQDVTITALDSPFDTPSLSRRTQSLPGILVGRELVKQTHLYTGEEIRVVSPLSDPSNPDATGTPIPFNRDYRVAGIFYTGMYEYDLKYVYVTLESLQEFLDRGDTIDGIEIRVSNPDDTDAFVSKLQAAFGPQYRVQDWKDLNRSLFSALKLEKIAMFLVLGIVILVASFSIVGNLIMVVVEKAREIALLKTLGASDMGVMLLFAIQGLMIGLIGTVLGVSVGLLVCWLLEQFGLPLNPDVYYIDRLPVHVDPMSVLAAASAGILISIAATFYPAVVAARVRPAAGMRH